MSLSDKISLPDFLKQLTSNKIPHSKAIHIASKIYKTHHTPAALTGLTNASLQSLGIEEKEWRRSTLAAFKKANWNSTSTRAVSTTEARANAHPRIGDIKSVGSTVLLPTSGPEGPKTKVFNTTSSGSTSPLKRKRSAVDDELPDRPPEEMESAKCGNFDFKEILVEDLLRLKSTVINRAPIMTAWATIVAERLGFEREESLSIASVYTEMNAVSKAVSIGVRSPNKGEGTQEPTGGSQPYVNLMGRRIPLYRSRLSHDRSQWRALSSGTTVSPLNAYKYITTSMRQTTPNIIGAMRVLAGSYEPEELNRIGFSLYCDFRPEIEPGKSGWGKRGKVSCETILKLRKERVEQGGVVGDINEGVKPTPTIQHLPKLKVEYDLGGEEPRSKRSRVHDTGELDEDELFGA